MAVSSETLQAFEPVLQATAAAILAGPDALEWRYLEARLLPDFEKKGWTLARPVHLLKLGARALADVTVGIDEQSAALIERVLQIVNAANSGVDSAAGSGGAGLRTPAPPTLFGNSVQLAIQQDDVAELSELMRIGWPLDAVLDGVRLQAQSDSGVGPDVRFNALSFAVLSGKPGMVSALLSQASIAGGAVAAAALIASRPPDRNSKMDAVTGMGSSRDAWDMQGMRNSVGGAGAGAGAGATNLALAPDALQWALFLTGDGKEAEAIASLLAAAADRATAARPWLRRVGTKGAPSRARDCLPIEQAIAREWWSVADLLHGRGASLEHCVAGGAAELAVGQFISSGNTQALSRMRQLGWDLNRALRIFTVSRQRGDGDGEEGEGNSTRDDPGFTALHYAVQLRQSASVKALLALGASPSVLTGSGESALELALQFAMQEKQRRRAALSGAGGTSLDSHRLAQRPIPGESIAIALLNAGADCNKMMEGVTPAPSAAAELGWFALTRQMVRGTAGQGGGAGCDLTLFDISGCTLTTRLVHLAHELATESEDMHGEYGEVDNSAISGPLAVLREIGARDRAAHSSAMHNGERYAMSVDFVPPADAEFGALPPLLHAVQIRTQAWCFTTEARGGSEMCGAHYLAAAATAVIKVLLGECSADRDVREPQHSRSALHLAALHGDVELAELLLGCDERAAASGTDRGAGVDARTATGRIANVNARSSDRLARPLDFALNRAATGHDPDLQAKCAELAVLLVRCGSDPNEALEPGVPGSPSSIAFASHDLALKMREAWKSRLQRQGAPPASGVGSSTATVSAAAPPLAPCPAPDAARAPRAKLVPSPPPPSATQPNAAASGSTQQESGAAPTTASTVARATACVATAEAGAAATPPAAVHVPDEFKCPISMELMSDPVSCVDGHSYERAAITTWLETNDTSPRTNLPLEAKILIPNHSLKAAIATFIESNPNVLTVHL